MSSLDLETVTAMATAMRGLADLPFEKQAFRHACERLGELQDPESDGYPMWEYELPDGTFLRQCHNEQDEDDISVVAAMVTLYAFEGPEPEWHDSMESFLRGRREFDDAYAIALAAAQAAAGPPLLSGLYVEDQLQWALWRGETGLFAVFQSYLDPIMGMELNYWVTPWAGPDPQPDDDFPEWIADCRSPE